MRFFTEESGPSLHHSPQEFPKIHSQTELLDTAVARGLGAKSRTEGGPPRGPEMPTAIRTRSEFGPAPTTLLPGRSDIARPPTPEAALPWHERWWPFTIYHRHHRRRTADRHASGRALAVSVCPCEVRALLHFVAARGLDPKSTLAAKLNDNLNAYQRALKAKDEETAHKLQTAVLKGYAALTQITYRSPDKVNGWTILSTEHVVGHIWVTIFWGILFFFLAASTQILSNFYAMPEHQGSNDDWLFLFHKLVLVYLFPFFWGGVGSCIYLAKTLGDKAAKSTFDSRKLRGQGTRIFLGAIMGAVVVHLFYRSVTLVSDGFGGVGPAGLAFLTGMGVKAIYGALERIIDSINNVIKSMGAPTTDSRADGTTR